MFALTSVTNFCFCVLPFASSTTIIISGSTAIRLHGTECPAKAEICNIRRSEFICRNYSGVRTLRTQDTSDPRHFGTGTSTVPNCLDISALVPKCLTDISAPGRQFGTGQHWTKPWQAGRLCLYVYSCNALPARFFDIDRALNSYFMIL